MAGEKERVDSYLDTVSRLEPDIATIDVGAGWASVAISLKRIADYLEPKISPQAAHELAARGAPGNMHEAIMSIALSLHKLAVPPFLATHPEFSAEEIRGALEQPAPLSNDDFIAASRHLANVTNSPADHAAETVRVVFQAVRWARENREPQRESTATMDHAGMPEDDPHGAFADVANIVRENPEIANVMGDLVFPDRQRDPVDESFVDYTGLDGPALLEALGADAMKWGEAFCQTAHKLGIVIDQPDWMGGWFANAMAMAEQRAVAPIQHERDQLYRHVEALLDLMRRIHNAGQVPVKLRESRHRQAATDYLVTIMPPMSLPSSDGVRCRCVLRLEKCTPDICRYGNAQGDSL